ncbi:MAG: hypothetical protein ACFE85_07690 [Candidatus Hodarchaeota archaeon]
MVDTSNILINFCQSLKNEILEFYKNSYSYFKDLYSYRNINIDIKFLSESEQIVNDTIKSLIASTNSALSTIGISMEDLTPENDLYNKIFEDKKEQYNDFQEFFEIGLKSYINKFLFQILLEYIMGIDFLKVTNLDLFDLLPPKFMVKLDDFKNKYKDSFIGKNQLYPIIKNIDYYFDVSNLSINEDKIHELDKIEEIPSNEDIIKQLQEARQVNIDVLKKAPIEGQKLVLDSFLNYFGNAPKLSHGMIEMVKINRFNLLNSGLNHLDFFDLESLFYYLSNLKMLGFDFPLKMEDIEKILQNYISGRVFSSAKFHKPNPISNFYGLSILTELNIMNETELIDLLDIEMYLEKELINFIPEKIYLNLFSVLSLILLEKNGGIIKDKKHLINPLLNIDLLNLENYNAPLDIFCYLSLLKAIDHDINFENLKKKIITELGKCITKNGAINDSITDSARTLLIIHLLNSQEQEEEVVDNLLKYITNTLNFFSDNDLDRDFNWDNDRLAYKVELRMIYWTLIAIAQYFS